MKKIIAMLLVMAMAFCLVACASDDYKKATELYNEGRFEEARAMFVELEDYEDSAQMVTACDYGIACQLLNDGQYTQAREKFLGLGDHEDSAQKVMECDYLQATAYMEAGEYQQARELFVSLGDYEKSVQYASEAAYYMLYAYVEEQGEIVKKSDDNSNGTVIMISEGELFVAYLYKISGFINIDMKIGAFLPCGENEMVIAGSDSCSSYAAYYTAEASTELDISTYKNGDALEWTNFSVDGTNAYGTDYEADTTWLYMFLTSGMNDITAHLAEVLEESGLGLEMKDIGFLAYE